MERVSIDGNSVDTTVGRTLFNQHLPKGVKFFNDTMSKSKLSGVINECYKVKGHQAVIKLLDDLKKVGFEEATKAGLSISVDDVAKSIEEVSGAMWNTFAPVSFTCPAPASAMERCSALAPLPTSMLHG